MSSTSHSTHAFARFAMVVLLLSLTTGVPAPAQARGPRPRMLRVPGGEYRPFYKGKAGTGTIPVGSFLLDRAPVTQGEFLRFLKRNPRWRHSRVTPLFAERGYLSDWPADLTPARSLDAPVTRVSWFAASAYCECQGRRLPTQAEWEWAAETGAVPRLAGYPGSVAPPSPPGTQSLELASVERPNRFAQDGTRTRLALGRGGPRGLALGEVWEWTSDFNTLLLADPSPDQSASSLFCGDGFRAADAKDYGGFLRFSFRSSLRASYALKNLGFRCAKDLP